MDKASLDLQVQLQKNRKEVDKFNGAIGFNQMRKMFRDMKEFYRLKGQLYCNQLKGLEKEEKTLKGKKDNYESLEKELKQETDKKRIREIKKEIEEIEVAMKKIKVAHGLLDVYVYELLSLGEKKKKGDKELEKHFLGLDNALAWGMAKGKSLFENTQGKDIKRVFSRVMNYGQLTLILTEVLLVGLIVYVLLLVFEKLSALMGRKKRSKEKSSGDEKRVSKKGITMNL